MLDYIVVGLGLSGLAVSEELEKRNRSFVVFDDHSQNSSYVAGGIFNPVVLKRFTLAWKADEQLKISIPFYKNLEDKLQQKFINNWNIYRRFHSVEEQNEWFVAADKPGLSRFLDPGLKKNTNPNLDVPYSFGMVQQTGNIETEDLLNNYITYLQKNDSFINERFDYSKLVSRDGFVEYKDLKARNIIFCEGFGIRNNPYFSYLPLRGNKGEYITIYSEDLDLDFAIKSSVFIMPLGNHLYKVGATYDHQDKTPGVTGQAREKLVKQLGSIIKCDFEVVDQVAGIRPAVADRRPLVGAHPEIKNMFCCNGFGSRGVLIAPSMAPKLLDLMEKDVPLDSEIDLQRFTKKHYKPS
ncbi:FAD-binding oxidoreductase [Gramella sp. GC03-9]|uniref:FAD-binding oxidoreductase n=1 Tax=Christiangramia oceanisediminis TaxID=2920386 RepID=A0A9X2KWL6_9FLAO|nr:FAD-dependent oxidoreductase [Gramella oceanisediminis]MCP9199603.1 FAD-binding oxidoreductase [Gramella oceanisediminis]